MGLTVKRTCPFASVAACAPDVQSCAPATCDWRVPVWFGTPAPPDVNVAVSTAVVGYTTDPAELVSDAVGTTVNGGPCTALLSDPVTTTGPDVADAGTT